VMNDRNEKVSSGIYFVKFKDLATGPQVIGKILVII